MFVVFYIVNLYILCMYDLFHFHCIYETLGSMESMYICMYVWMQVCMYAHSKAWSLHNFQEKVKQTGEQATNWCSVEEITIKDECLLKLVQNSTADTLLVYEGQSQVGDDCVLSLGKLMTLCAEQGLQMSDSVPFNYLRG
jgi:hypothetical protein